MDYIITNGELCHHGIKGQKWGVRRFQNADGTLTSAGKTRKTHSMKKAQKVYDRVHGVRNDAKRMSRMSDRQKQSLENAEKYWKAKAEGEKPTEKRSVIQRHYDKSRSYNKYQRAGKQFAIQMMRNTIATSVLYSQTGIKTASTGEIAAAAVIRSTQGVAVNELANKAFGHF